MLNFIEYNQNNKYLSGIYCITNTIDNRIYIGSTNCFYKRFYEHNRDFCKNKHNNIHLQRFINKYGIDSIKYKIIEILDFNFLLEKEQWYLDTYINFEKDFNICKIVGTPPNYNRSFTENQIKEIANLYNSGKSCCQISEILFNNRNQRSKIASMVKGISYSEYKKLFNYKKYSQIGRTFGQETKNKIGIANSGTRVLSISDIEFIKNNFDKVSGRKIASLLNKSKSVIAYYIKNNIKNGL
jgi:group I intron endonuclease